MLASVANLECCFKVEGSNKISDILEANILVVSQKLWCRWWRT